MLDRRFVREHPDVVKKKFAERDYDTTVVDALLQLDVQRRGGLGLVEDLKQRKNTVSKEIGELKKKGKDAEDKVLEMREVGEQITKLEGDIAIIEERLEQAEMSMPNLQDGSVPTGKTGEDNVEIRRWGEPQQFSFEPLPHWEIGERLGILDFERAAKIAGARFALLRGAGARMERALIGFMLDIHTREHGYEEILPPFMVNRESLVGTGQLPKFEKDLFGVRDSGYYLIPTAEVPVTNIHRGEILDEAALPVKYAAYTPCFRSEAGSYGKDTRGYIRQHQFNKVELVKLATPETSFDELESLTVNAEEILKRLRLHYRVVSLCSGDLGFASAKTYDLEVWLPSEKGYKEISSCSNFKDFQARRASLRYRPGAGKAKAKVRFVHTLNGSGLAVGRTLVAILEQCQNEDGTVTVPEALRPYMDGLERVERA